MKVIDEKQLAVVKGGMSGYKFGKYVGMFTAAFGIAFRKQVSWNGSDFGGSLRKIFLMRYKNGKSIIIKKVC